jgi:hypothetical protein
MKAEIPLIQCDPYNTMDDTTTIPTIISRRIINHFSILPGDSGVSDVIPIPKWPLGLNTFTFTTRMELQDIFRDLIRFMVDAEEWMHKLAANKKYRIVTRYIDENAVFIGIGAVGEKNNPAFSFRSGVTMMLPWQGIDLIEPVD